MRLSIITIRDIEAGIISIDDLTPSQQIQFKQVQLDKKIVENQIDQQIVTRLKTIGKFDVNEIGKILERYAQDEEEFWGIYSLLDFKWINQQLIEE